MSMARNKNKLFDAYFISPRPQGRIYPVENTHIQEVIQHSHRYGVSLKAIKDTYRKYDEALGIESFAREELLTKILSRGFVRIRIKNHTVCCQVGQSAKKLKYARKIFCFLRYLKRIVGANRYRNYALRVYIRQDENWIDEFAMARGEEKLIQEMENET